MSFRSIIKNVVQAALVAEHAAAPAIELIAPAAAGPIGLVDAIVARVQTSILAQEVANPADGAGLVKGPAVIADFTGALEPAQETLKADGKKLIYDTVALADAINAQVEAYNAFAKLKASFKVVPAGLNIGPLT